MLIQRLFVAAILFCVPVDLPYAQITRYVDGSATDAVHDGTTWCRAYIRLQDALVSASPGDTIRVADGAYTPDRGGGESLGDRAATFRLLDDVTLEGGYAGCAAANPDARNFVAFESVLSGDLNGDDGPSFINSAENSLHVVSGATNVSAVLDGFTISGGHADFGERQEDSYGGGLLNLGERSTIIHCTFVDNFAASGAAGVDSFGGSHVRLTESTIADASIVDAGSTLTLDQSDIVQSLFVGSGSLVQGSGILRTGVFLCPDSGFTSRGTVRANVPGMTLSVTGGETSTAGGTFEAVNDGVLLINTDLIPESGQFCAVEAPCLATLRAEGGTIRAGQDY